MSNMMAIWFVRDVGIEVGSDGLRSGGWLLNSEVGAGGLD